MIKIEDSEVKNVLFNGNNCKEVYFNGKLVFKSGITLFDKILADNVIKTNIPNFLQVPTDAESGLYQAEDDQGTVYYFRGNVKNNWVKFAGFYWRIIRTNGDGSVRILYAGTSHDTTNAFIQTGVYNPARNNTIYVGYMYGSKEGLENNRQNTTNSSIKSVIDNWYSINLNANYNDYISQTAIYCNDRSGDGYKSSDDVVSSKNNMTYATYNRLIRNKKPSYKCGNNENGILYNDASNLDKFSKSTSGGGNGKLTYPIALMTADEVMFAGAKYGSSSQVWYYYNSFGDSITGSKGWWTMSPSNFDGLYGGGTNVFTVSGSGTLGTGHVGNSNICVRPVISLKNEVLTTGSGTAEDPYIVG